MANLFAQVVKPDQLTENDKSSMYDLYSQYYGASDENMFVGDLGEKDFVIVLRNTSGSICGFSTILLVHFEQDSRPRLALFSGDTVIHHDYWGSQILAMTWCRLAGSIKSQHPDTPIYWFLIVKGYRTYRYLPLYSKLFYPTWRYPTPEYMQSIMDYLAELKFGKSYKKDKGIIQFESSKGHLIGEWSDIPDHVREHKDVNYFLEKNPGYKNGDELVCCTELNEENLRSYALRAFKEDIAS